MVQKKLSLRSKAAHLVSDITTVLLNPISDDPCSPSGNDAAKKNPNGESPETESRILVDPDTSSFTAFLTSLLSSADTSDHFSSRSEESPSSSKPVENPGRKSVFSRGKQSLSKAFQKASRITGKRTATRSNSDISNDSGANSIEIKETLPRIPLPEISDSSLLISDNLRGDLYRLFPTTVMGKYWVLLYSTWKHGISLSTLYRRSALCPGFCLLARTIRSLISRIFKCRKSFSSDEFGRGVGRRGPRGSCVWGVNGGAA